MKVYKNKKTKKKYKATKMQKWLTLQYVGFLQWPIIFCASDFIKRLQKSFACIISISIIFL
jgi:hypothetical protein